MFQCLFSHIWQRICCRNGNIETVMPPVFVSVKSLKIEENRNVSRHFTKILKNSMKSVWILVSYSTGQPKTLKLNTWDTEKDNNRKYQKLFSSRYRCVQSKILARWWHRKFIFTAKTRFLTHFNFFERIYLTKVKSLEYSYKTDTKH